MGLKDKKLLSKQGFDPVPLAFKTSMLPHSPGEQDRPYYTCFQGKFNVRCTIGATLHYYRIWNMDGSILRIPMLYLHDMKSNE